MLPHPPKNYVLKRQHGPRCFGKPSSLHGGRTPQKSMFLEVSCRIPFLMGFGFRKSSPNGGQNVNKVTKWRVWVAALLLLRFWLDFRGPGPSKSVLASTRELDFRESRMFEFWWHWDVKRPAQIINKPYIWWSGACSKNDLIFECIFYGLELPNGPPYLSLWRPCGVHFLSWEPFWSQKGPKRTPELFFVHDFHGFWTNLARLFSNVWWLLFNGLGCLRCRNVTFKT